MYYCTFLFLFYYLKTNKKFEKKKRNSKKISKARLLLNLILVWSDIVKWYLSHSFRGNCRNLLSWKSYLFFHGVKMVEGRRGSVCTVIFCNPFATLVNLSQLVVLSLSLIFVFVPSTIIFSPLSSNMTQCTLLKKLNDVAVKFQLIIQENVPVNSRNLIY